jgi:hypothetical protein
MNPIFDLASDSLDRVDRQSALLTRFPHVLDKLLPIEFLSAPVALYDLQAKRDAFVRAEPLPTRWAFTAASNALSALDVP